MKKKLLFAIGIVIIMLPVVFAICNWDKFPEKIVIHYSAKNIPNGWAGRFTALIFIPIVMFFAHTIVFFSFKLTKKKQPALFEWLCLLIFPVVSIVVALMNFAQVYNYEINIYRIAMIIVSCVFMVTGFALADFKEKGLSLLLIHIMSFEFFIGGISLFILILIADSIISVIVLSVVITSILVTSLIYFIENLKK